MAPDESSIAKLFEPELNKLRLEFGQALTTEVVSVIARQLAEQVQEYEPESGYLWQRFGTNPTYSVGVDFAAITRDLRAYVRQRAVTQLAELRVVAQLN